MTDDRAPPEAASTGWTACVGCGGRVRDIDGPTHPYMVGSPGCWKLYGEWLARRGYSPALDPLAAVHHVDCFAVQHPGNADRDRRQRQSVAVHLISLCLLQEFDFTPSRAGASRSHSSATVLPALGLTDWPLLSAPTTPPEVTIVDVAAAPEGAEGAAVTRWAESSWLAWAEHHETVRSWARIMAASG